MSAASSSAPVRRSLLVIAPLVIFAALALVFFIRLRSGADPAAIPSALIGRPVPAFALPALPNLVGGEGQAVPGLSSADLKGPRDGGQFLGVVVCPVPDRASATDAAGA